jgi:ATP-dependent Clp protease protease subunit
MEQMKKDEDHNHNDTNSFSCDYKAREIYLMGFVDTNSVHDCISALRQLDRSGSGAINLIICSHGGQDDAGFAIYDAIEMTKSKVIAHVYGECKSIAVLILQACDTRILAPNCRLMVHNGSVSFGSLTMPEVKSYSKEFFDTTSNYVKCISDRTGLSIEQVQEMCDKETYMSAEVALGLGFADYVYSTLKVPSSNTKYKTSKESSAGSKKKGRK